MTLTTKQRSSIYRKLVPILGEDDADALMTEFPAAEHDQLVTREHLRAELAELRTELHTMLNRNLVATVASVLTAIGVVAALN